jgi:aminoglycoside 6-adenylyltransferase
MTGALLDEILRWAHRRDDLRAVVLTGSHARGQADALSDLDIELFTTDRARYERRDWTAEIRPVWVQLGFGPTEERPYVVRLTVFEGGEKVDFSVGSIAVLQSLVEAGELSDLYERGYRVLVDKDGIAAKLPAAGGSPPPAEVPTEADFEAVVEEFWFEAWHIPKYLERGELWVVKLRDWTMKGLLLRMLEWEGLTRDVDVWHIGIQLEHWAAPGAWGNLHRAFGHFDAEDSRRALLETTALFVEVSRTVATRLSFRYPSELEEAIAGSIRGS